MTRKRFLILGGGLLIAAAVAWTLLGDLWSGGTASRADAGNRALVALGGEVYARACAACHGKALEGQPDWRKRDAAGKLPAPPHDASGHTWHHDDFTLFALTRNGPAAVAGADYASDMPAFAGTLSDDEIWAVLAYIKSNWPKIVQDRQAKITLQAEGQRP